MTDILFIGGYGDGKMKSFPNTINEFYRLPEPHPPIYSTEASVYQSARGSEYRIERFRTPTKDFVFYVEVGLTIEQAVAKLLAGYRP